jgi:hypothetical protein
MIFLKVIKEKKMKFNFEVKVIEKNNSGIKLECTYNNRLQGNLEMDINKNDLAIGVTDYINIGSGMITLRKAVPETDFSEYNIVKMLCDKFNSIYPDKKITPEMFGYKSYETLKLEEIDDERMIKYKNMSNEELIAEIINLSNKLEKCYENII